MIANFGQFQEVCVAIDDFVVEHAQPPRCLYVSLGVFTWMLSMQSRLPLASKTIPLPESFILPTQQYGDVIVRVDTRLQAYEVSAE